MPFVGASLTAGGRCEVCWAIEGPANIGPFCCTCATACGADGGGGAC